jgi:hypothetical protein
MKTAELFTLIGISCLTLVLPARAQERELNELLSGRTIPLTQTLKDLSSDWRRITVSSSGTVSGNVSVNVTGDTTAATSQNNLTGAVGSGRSYVTKGEVVSARGRAYLVAYHLPAVGLDVGKLLQALTTKASPTVAALTLESALPLSLLDLSSIGSLDDVRPFEAKTEIADSENAIHALSQLFKSQNGGSKTTNSVPKEKDDSDK